MKRTVLWLGLSLALSCTAIAASANQGSGNEPLSCMAETYTEDQNARLDELLAQLDLFGEDADPVSDEIVGIIAEAVAACEDNGDWVDDPEANALIYEFTRLTEVAYRLYGPLTADDLAKLDTALARGNRRALWAAMEAQALSGMTGVPSPTDTQDILIAGQFMMELGVGFDLEKAENIGLLLGYMALNRYAAREFAALQ